jgi:hypothetical protein
MLAGNGVLSAGPESHLCTVLCTVRPLEYIALNARGRLAAHADSVSPRFQTIAESILLIPRQIAQESLCGYWEHADQFAGPGL